MFTAEDAWITLQGGFTTVQSVGAAIDGAVRDRITRGLLPGPRVLTSLRQITNRSGDPDALRALVRQSKQEGADVIKLFATSGLGAGGDQTMTDEQRKSVALEYLKAFDNKGVTSSGGSILDLFADDAQVFFPKWGLATGKTQIRQLFTDFGGLLKGILHDYAAFN